LLACGLQVFRALLSCKHFGTALSGSTIVMQAARAKIAKIAVMLRVAGNVDGEA